MGTQRAVILGAAGFIGSHLADRFLAEGWDVLGVDNLVTGTLANLAHLRREPRFQFLEQDICRPYEVTGPVAEYIRQGIDLVLEKYRGALPGQLTLDDVGRGGSRR